MWSTPPAMFSQGLSCRPSRTPELTPRPARSRATSPARTSSAAGGEVPGFADPASRAHIEAYAAIKGEILQQTAVTWTRAFESPAKFLHNGVDIPLGRTVTPDEAASLSRLLQADPELEVVILPIEDGVSIFYVPDDVLTAAKESATPEVRAQLQAKRKDLLQRVSAAAEEVYPEFKESDVTAAGRTFSTDGGYIENDWKANPNAEVYKQTYAAFDGPSFDRVWTSSGGVSTRSMRNSPTATDGAEESPEETKEHALDEIAGIRSEPAGGAGAATEAGARGAEPTGAEVSRAAEPATGYYAERRGPCRSAWSQEQDSSASKQSQASQASPRRPLFGRPAPGAGRHEAARARG